MAENFHAGPERCIQCGRHSYWLDFAGQCSDCSPLAFAPRFRNAEETLGMIANILKDPIYPLAQIRNRQDTRQERTMNKANRRWEKDPEYKGGYKTVSDVGPVTPVRVFPPKPDGTVEIQAWYPALGEGTANIGAVKWYANRLLEATALAEMLEMQQESAQDSEPESPPVRPSFGPRIQESDPRFFIGG